MEGVKFDEHKKCLISGSNILYPLKGYERHYLVKSKATGFVFCSRIPTQEELIAHYNTYSRNNFISPITIKNYQVLLKGFEKYRNTGRILDIGCGDGYFLETAKKMGWEVYGTEYTDEALKVCREKRINMQQGKLDPTKYGANFFDVITSFEVIEHINNPIEEVKNIYTILRKGGLVYLTTPNFNAIERFLLKDQYSVIGYPEHLSYYTPNSLHFLFEKIGFKKQSIKTTGISFTRVKNAFSSTKEPLVAEASMDELIRTKLSNNVLLSFGKTFANTLLNFFGVGNSLKGWFVKI